MKKIIILFIMFSIVACKNTKEHYLNSKKKYDKKTFASIIKSKKYKKIKKINIERNSSIRIKFDLINKTNNVVRFADYIKEYKIIKLETTDNTLIADISKIIFCKHNVICVDATHTKTINIFDSTGKFKHKIDALGKGPGEYIDITSVTFDTNKSIIKVYDFIQNRILSYNLQGKFVQMEKAKFKFSNFQYQNKKLIYNNDNGLNSHLNQASLNQLLIEDNNNSLYYGLPFFDEKIAMNFFNSNSFTSNDMGYLYYPMLSDTLYEITDYGVKVKYIIECNPQSINYHEKHDVRFYTDFLKERNKKQYVYISRAIETDSLLLLSFRYGSKNMWGIYNKITTTTDAGIGLAMNKNKMPVWCNPIMSYNDFFVGYSNALSVIKDIEWLKDQPDSVKRKHKKTLELFKNISEYDNPVIIMYKISGLK